MPQWLAQDPTTIYVILGAVALVVLVLAWMNRDKSVPLGSGGDRRKPPCTINAFALGGLVVLVLALLAGGVRLIDYLVVTEQEKIIRSVQELADGVKAHDTERVFREVSESFQGAPRGNKKEFKEFARQYIDHGGVTDVTVWEFDFPEGVSADKGTARVEFLAKVKGGLMGGRDDLFWRVDAVYCLDPDKKWRLRSFVLKNPANNDIVPVPY